MESKKSENILDRIVERKKIEIANARRRMPITLLEEREMFSRNCHSLRASLLDPKLTGIIAEYKRRSPSKGVINDRHSVKEITRAYAAGGASALSVLTDKVFFGGMKQDLLTARRHNELPILRKDFILDEYQIIEAKSIGADIILLIASILTPDRIKALANLSKQLGMNVLLEVHSREELDMSICQDLDAIGVNNRNLGTFEVSLDHSLQLAEYIPDQFLKISESGINDPQTIKELRTAGYQGFLIGENFMRSPEPGKTFREFVSKIR